MTKNFFLTKNSFLVKGYVFSTQKSTETYNKTTIFCIHLVCVWKSSAYVISARKERLKDIFHTYIYTAPVLTAHDTIYTVYYIQQPIAYRSANGFATNRKDIHIKNKDFFVFLFLLSFYIWESIIYWER